MHKDCADRVSESLHNSFDGLANAYYLRISSWTEQRDQDARTSFWIWGRIAESSGDSSTSITAVDRRGISTRTQIQDLTGHVRVSRRIYCRKGFWIGWLWNHSMITRRIIYYSIFTEFKNFIEIFIYLHYLLYFILNSVISFVACRLLFFCTI